ncbi:MAG: acyl-CoA dehydrogenase family protein [Polyangiaceae bacterium]|nr:acyl-CoA dehydrogenase family protein [Polyangiaceae bacterium]
MTERPKSSFMVSLSVGEIEEDILFPFPKMDPKEQETLQTVLESIDSLLKPKAKEFGEWDRAAHLPDEFLEELRQFGLFGLVIPEEHGGVGFGSTAYSRTLQQISKYDASVAVTVGAHSSIGMRGLLLFGNEEQRARYYPKLAAGEMIAAFCLTEPTSGSDAASIRTRAEKDGDDYILNGEKIWITNGGIADFFTVFAKTGAADERKNLSAFIVTRDMPGVSTGPHENKMGLRASSTTTVHFDNVRIPKANLLGEEGKGFKVAMNILNSGRTGLGGGSVGGMKRLIALASKQATERVQFGKPISEYGLIKQKVGQMVIDCYATESVVSMVAGLVDQKVEDYAIEAAISKVLASECLWRSADEALQIAAGNGYMCEFPYERLVRDCRINRIFEGTNEILRLFIALSAMNDVGAELKELSRSLKGVFDDPIKGFGVVRDYALRRAALATGVPREKSRLTKVHPALKAQAGIFEDKTRDLATAADRLLRRHGKLIIEKQFATRRLADIMIDLFALGCVLSRVTARITAEGESVVSREIDIAKAFAGQAQRRIDVNLIEIDKNEDELVKGLADFAFEREGYAWDTV